MTFRFLSFLICFNRGARLTDRNAEGQTALHVAAASGCIEALVCLVQHGANVNATDSLNANSPLHLAALGGQAVAVDLLLNRLGADPTLATATGLSALQLTVSARVRRILESATAPAEVRASSGHRLLMGGSTSIYLQLLQLSARLGSACQGDSSSSVPPGVLLIVIVFFTVMFSFYMEAVCIYENWSESLASYPIPSGHVFAQLCPTAGHLISIHLS